MSKRPFQKDRVAGFRIILVLVALLLIWATVLGVGVILNSEQNLLKPTIIFGTAGLFCVVWIAALAQRKRWHDSATRSAQEERTDSHDIG